MLSLSALLRQFVTWSIINTNMKLYLSAIVARVRYLVGTVDAISGACVMRFISEADKGSEDLPLCSLICEQ